MIALFAVHQDASGQADRCALSYAPPSDRPRRDPADQLREECEADLFNEQAVLWGAIPELIQAGFDTLGKPASPPKSPISNA
jgi:ketol-acid reductoisomerase